MATILFEKPADFGAANFVMDFQMDIIDINEPNILIKKGPNLDKMDKQDKNYISSAIMELWTDINESTENKRMCCSNTHTAKKFICFGCCIYIILLIALVAILESHLPIFPSTETKQIVAIVLGGTSVVILALILFTVLCVMQQRASIKEKWRDRFVHYLCVYINDLKQQYPNLTFSIIYPILVYSHRTKTSPAINHHKTSYLNDLNHSHADNEIRGDEYVSAIWCYLRVSEGSIITTDSEPVLESTHENMRRDTDTYSRITGVTLAYSLNIEDESRSMIDMRNKKKSSFAKQNKKKKLSQKGSVQTGRFPVLAKKMGYKQLT